MLLNVIRDRAPEYVAVAFDRPEPTFRHDIYPAYKANRDAAPEDLVEQIPYMHRVIEVLRIPLLVQPGAEADDIIGTMAARGNEPSRLVTNDSPHLIARKKEATKVL